MMYIGSGTDKTNLSINKMKIKRLLTAISY